MNEWVHVIRTCTCMCNVMVEEMSTPATDYSHVENMGGPGYTYESTHRSEQAIMATKTIVHIYIYVATNLHSVKLMHKQPHKTSNVCHPGRSLTPPPTNTQTYTPLW